MSKAKASLSCFVSYVRILFAVLGPLACQPRSTTGQSLVNLAIDADVFGCNINGFPDVIDFDAPQSLAYLQNLTACQRRALVILAEAAQTSYKKTPDAKRTMIQSLQVSQLNRYFQLNQSQYEVALEKYLPYRIEPVTNRQEIDRILSLAGVYQSQGLIYVPVHPQATRLPAALTGAKWIGHAPGPAPKPTLVQTMSRSLWSFFPEDSGLYTIKMGSDIVHGCFEPHKLDDVDGDFEDFKLLVQKTKIMPMMAMPQITYIPDSYVVKVRPKGVPSHRNNTYSIIVRSYEKVLADRSHIYVPYHGIKAFAKRSQIKSRPPTIDLEFMWGHRIRFKETYFRAQMDQLNILMGQTVAVHHANGYRPLDFHVQNLLMGLPVDFNDPPKLGIRDVADVYETNFDGKDRAPHDPGFRRISTEDAKIYPPIVASQAFNPAYAHKMQELHFKIDGVDWNRVDGSISLERLWNDSVMTKPAQFKSEVQRVLGGGAAP